MVDANSQIAQVTGQVFGGVNLSNLGFSTFQILTYFIIGFFFIVAISVGLWIFLSNLKFNNKIIVWEKINGRWEITRRDKACVTSFGSSGDKVFFLKKARKYLPIGEIQTGRRTYWYAIREDQEWINIGMEDIDTAMKRVKSKFLHTEMRAWRTSFQSNLRQRLDKPSFMQQYGTIVVSIIFIIICGLIMFFLTYQVVQAIQKLQALFETATKVMAQNERILATIDNLQNNGRVVAQSLLPFIFLRRN